MRRKCFIGILLIAAGNTLRANVYSSDGTDITIASELFPDAVEHPTADFIRDRAQNFTEDSQALASNIGQQNRDLGSARAQFWKSYPNGPNHAEDAKRLNDALMAKDLWYTWVAMLPDNDRPGLNILTGGTLYALDGGIPASASDEFDSYIKMMKDKFNGQAFSFTNLPEILGSSWAAGQDQYNRYLVARNWSEIDAGPIHLSAAQFARMLVERYPRALTPTESDAQYKTMVAIFGADQMAKCAARVEAIATLDPHKGYSIPEDALAGLGMTTYQKAKAAGNLPPGQIEVEQWPLDVWLQLLAQAGGRPYFLVENALVRDPGWSEPGSLVPWDNAIATYDQLVSSYGEPAVLDAIGKVRGLPGKDVGGTYAGSSLGLPDIVGLDTAVTMLLARNDVEGFAKSLVLDPNARNDPHFQDLPALYAAYGKNKVLAAAANVRDGGFADMTNSSSAYSRLLAAMDSHPPNNPFYLSWAKWPLGTRVTYHEVQVKYPVTHADTSYELSSVNPQAVTLVVSVHSAYAPESGLHWEVIPAWCPDKPANTSVDYRAPIHPTSLSNFDYNMATPSGNMTLARGGSSLPCEARILNLCGVTTAYFSDAVPGLFVASYDTSIFADRTDLTGLQNGNGTPSNVLFTAWPTLGELPPFPATVPPPTAVPTTTAMSVPTASTSPPSSPSASNQLQSAAPTTSQSQNTILAIVRESSRFTGTAPQPGYGNWQVQAELDWDDANQKMTGWIYLPQLGSKKRWEGKIVEDSGRNFLQMKETAVIDQAPGSNALLGVTYRMYPVAGGFRGPWSIASFHGNIILSPMTRFQ